MLLYQRLPNIGQTFGGCVVIAGIMEIVSPCWDAGSAISMGARHSDSVKKGKGAGL